MSIREINLTQEQQLFYNLNIIHDIIHDYGYKSADTRWGQNVSHTKQFIRDNNYTLFTTSSNINENDDMEGGAEKRGRDLEILTENKFPRIKESTLSTISNKELSDENKIKSKPKESYYTFLLKKQNDDFVEFVEYIKTNFVFQLFTYLLESNDSILNPFLPSNQKMDTSTNICSEQNYEKIYEMAYQIIVPSKEEEIIHDYEYKSADTIPTSASSHENDDMEGGKRSREYDDHFQENPQSKISRFEEPKVSSVSNLTDNIETVAPSDIPIETFYYQVADLFASYLIDIYLIRKCDMGIFTWESLFNYLSDFLDSNYDYEGQQFNVIDYSIIDTIFIDTKKGETSKMDQSGGADPSPEEVEKALAIRDLISGFAYDHPKILEIENILADTQRYTEDVSSEINPLLQGLQNDIQDRANNEQSPEKELLEQFLQKVNSLKLPNGRKLSKGLQNSFNIDRLNIEKQILKPYLIVITANEKINTEKAKVIQKQEDKEKKAKKEAEKELEKQQKKIEREEQRDASSSLGPETESVRKEFLTLIAKLGLYVNENENMITNNIDKKVKVLIDLETEILKYYSRDMHDRSPYSDLDAQLLKAITNFIPGENNMMNKSGNAGRYFCPKVNKKYMINNAADTSVVSTAIISKYGFCPVSSIVDGMLQCTIGGNDYDAADIEYGNMHFKIQKQEDNLNEKMNPFYEGILKINATNNKIIGSSVTYYVNYKGFNNNVNVIETSIENIKIKPGKVRDLEAKTALKNTLVNILKTIETIYGVNQDLGSYITNHVPIQNFKTFFDNIFNVIKNQAVTNAIEPSKINVDKPIIQSLLNAVFTILGKGSGDIFQEINSVCKNGGYYQTDVQYNNDLMIQWPSNGKGDCMRFFAATDRPSAARFVFLLLQGKPAEINQLAFGGYISKSEGGDCIVFKPKKRDGKIVPVCDYSNINKVSGGTRRLKNKYRKTVYKKDNKSPNHRDSKKIKRQKRKTIKK